MRGRWLSIVSVGVFAAGCFGVVRPTAAETYTATAYALHGKTADGGQTRAGIVAADPRVLPLGTRIRVTNAGAQSGDYVVADTGARMRGRIIDIYVGSTKVARAFGRRRVQVEVLSKP